MRLAQQRRKAIMPKYSVDVTLVRDSDANGLGDALKAAADLAAEKGWRVSGVYIAEQKEEADPKADSTITG